MAEAYDNIEIRKNNRNYYLINYQSSTIIEIYRN